MPPLPYSASKFEGSVVQTVIGLGSKTQNSAFCVTSCLIWARITASGPSQVQALGFDSAGHTVIPPKCIEPRSRLTRSWPTAVWG